MKNYIAEVDYSDFQGTIFSDTFLVKSHNNYDLAREAIENHFFNIRKTGEVNNSIRIFGLDEVEKIKIL